jgi:hypothetical protein
MSALATKEQRPLFRRSLKLDATFFDRFVQLSFSHLTSSQQGRYPVRLATKGNPYTRRAALKVYYMAFVIWRLVVSIFAQWRA